MKKSLHIIVLAVAVSGLMSSLEAIRISDRAGNFAGTGHGDRLAGRSRDRSVPKGSCRQCHEEGAAAAKHFAGLKAENDNALCYGCHADENPFGTFPGWRIYDPSSHATDPRMLWPGPYPRARRELHASGKCINCHDAHGKTDREGPIPALLAVREDELCITCHRGNVARTDVARDIRKPYGHFTRRTMGRHSYNEGGDPLKYAYTGGNRHASCSDCHNAHAIGISGERNTSSIAPNLIARVSRIRVQNGPPKANPGYQYLAANDTSTPVQEYEICFKCHSSWTRQPPGQDDMAKLFNTNNASFHPVESQGKDLNISPLSFVNGVMAFTIVSCSDCHGSDDQSTRGPHGSQFANLLSRPYEAHSTSRTVTRDELCFACHNFDTYANAFSSPASQQASRFNPSGGVGGHVFHVGLKGVPCYACHDSHGSPDFIALLARGRNPGLLNFMANPNGGSCLSTCHTLQSYVVNYPR